jgi:ubiquinone/menaquinone biosynthesis C-methylase UbiE
MLNKEQYETAKNFNARVYLNGRFKTNPEVWHQWIFKHLPAAENLKVLELGCGTGLFWLLNSGKIPGSWQVTLSDYSQGMLDGTRQNLRGTGFPFYFEIVNAEDLRYQDEHFDVIIANLMLYHVPDRTKALSGISRILKTDGFFYASTFSRMDMLELNLILYRYLIRIGKAKPVRENSFSLENGYAQLEPYFSKIQLLKYEDHLEISEVDPIIDYYLSFNNIEEGFILLEDGDIDGFRETLHEELERSPFIRVTKDMGMFYCQK